MRIDRYWGFVNDYPENLDFLVDRYRDAAEAAFTDEISDNRGGIGLLFIKDAKEPSLVYNNGNTAVSLSPLICQVEIIHILI